MKSTFEDKLADIMIGEAVTALLDEDLPISLATLTERLRTAIEGENDGDRARAGLRAIEEVRCEMKARAEQKDAAYAHGGLQPVMIH